MTKQAKLFSKVAIALSLIALAVAWRIVNFNYHIAPNLEIVTTVSVLAAVILGWRFALMVSLGTMIISDLVIGNTSIFVYTWSAFAIIGLTAVILRKLNHKPALQIASSLGFAIASSFAFFIITNFGVWAEGWYGPTFSGLINCFVAAIPFYRTMLIGNIILVPSVIALWQLVRVRYGASSIVNALVSK